MADSMSVNLRGLKELIARFDAPEIKNELNSLANNKGIVAIVSQAIADNFDKEGPGWQKLHPATIRNSISKAMRKRLVGENMIKKKNGEEVQARMILQRTGMLKKSATVLGAPGNVYRVEGTHLIFGTNLHYAAVHNNGGTLRNPGTKNGFGLGIEIPPHNIKMPKREFMVVRDEWKKRLNDFVTETALRTILKYIKRGR